VAKMKGFMHMVEIIIVMLAMFVVIIQLVGTPPIDTDWSKVSAFMKANDILHTVDASGVDWFNGAQVSSAINGTLNMSNTIYSVKLSNVIKPNMRVGCLCFNAGEFNSVQAALETPGFSINGQTPNMHLENITADEMPLGYDAIIVMDRNISYTNAYKYLANGGGIVEVRDLNNELAGPKENYGDEGEVHELLFGIQFSLMGASEPSQDAITFNPSATFPNSTYYGVYKYFSNIPNGTGMKINATHYFQNFLSSGEQMAVIVPSARALMNQTGTGAPALIVNSAMAGGKGRTAWLSGADLSGDDMAVLLKSLVIWSSGEEYYTVPSFTMVAPITVKMVKVYNLGMMQPIEISLTVGSVY